jgi:hypothetical protein
MTNHPNIDGKGIRKLDPLLSGALQVGQKGKMNSSSWGLDFEVKKVKTIKLKMDNDCSEDVSDTDVSLPASFRAERDRPVLFPPVQVKAIFDTMTDQLEDDFLNSEQQKSASGLRRFEAYFKGNNEWRRDRKTNNNNM